LSAIFSLLLSWQLQSQSLDTLKIHSMGLAEQGLYIEAIKEMDLVFDLAQRQTNDSMMIAALYYKIKWTTTHQENLLDTLIADCVQISHRDKGLIRNFAHLWLSHLYLQIFWSNQEVLQDGLWQESDASTDFRRWSKSRLYEMAEFHLNEALLGDLNHPVLRFKEFIDVPANDDIVYRPTLYEVFFDRWLEFHKQQSEIKDAFSEIDLQTDTLLFATGEGFITNKQKFAGKKNYMEKMLYQFTIFLKYQLNNNHNEAYLDYELSRLKLVYNYSLHPDKDIHFKTALNRLLHDSNKNEAAHLVYAEMAEYTYRMTGDAAEALKLCDTVINEFPGSFGAKKCRLLQNDILRPEITVSGSQVVLPGEKHVSFVTIRNIPELFLTIVKIPALHDAGRDSLKNLKYLLQTSKIVFSAAYKVPGNKNFESVSLDYTIPALPLGKYLLIWSDHANQKDWIENSPIVTSIFHVSRLGFFNYSSKDSLHFMFFNRKTGNGILGANIEINALEYTYNGLQSAGRYFLRSDKSGAAALKWQKPYLIKTKLWKGRDTLQLEFPHFAATTENGDRSFRFAEIYTDRSIYRPGQIIFFKGLLLSDPGNGIKSTIPYKPVEVALYDAGNEKIASGDFTSNGNGSISGSFTIPEDKLLGTYYIQVTTPDGTAGSRALKVEAYKRPSYYVQLSKETNENKSQDSITVSAKAIHFDLSPVQGAKLTYQIYRFSPSFFISSEIRSKMTQASGNYIPYLSGAGVVGKDGSFAIRFKNLLQKFSKLNSGYYAYGYRIEVTVTDVNGESQFAGTDIYPGDKTYELKVSWPQNGDICNLPPLDVELTNQERPLQGSFKILRLKKDPVDIFRELRKKYSNIQGFDPWVYLQQKKDSLVQFYDTDEVYNGRIPLLQKDSAFRPMAGGVFLLMAFPEVSHEQQNQLVSVHIFSDVENGKTSGDAAWSFLKKGNTFSPGQTCEIKCAGNFLSQQVFSIIEKNGIVLETFKLKITSGKFISIPVKLAYTGDVFVHLIYARNGVFFRDTFHLRIPMQNRKINLKMVSEIKTLKPGSEVSFNFKTESKDTDLSKTEWLACMYDASLDQFTPHSWNTWFDQSSYSYLTLYYPGFEPVYGQYMYPDWNFKSDTVIFYDRMFPSIKWPGEVYDMNHQFMYRNGGVAIPDAQPVMMAAESDAREKDSTPPARARSETSGQGILIRKDFRETAFFYPHLKTDGTGQIQFQCKVPDALTKWRIMIFAHSDIGQTGYFEEVFSTTLDAVVFPYTPRFLITGDSIEVTAKLVNHLNTSIDGVISLDLLDPLTGDTIQSHTIEETTQQAVSVASNSSENFSWNISVSDDIPQNVKFVFRYTGSASGDEIQTVVPVLSPLQLQRMTRPFIILGTTPKKIEFPLDQQLKNEQAIPVQFTLELAQNPLWFAIQALPYIEETVYESSDQLIHKMFGYHLSSQILNKHPYLPELYSKALSDQDALKDDLRISRTLQTPWNMVYVKKKKTKQEVMQFFNLNQCQMELKQTIDKLGKYQHPDGGISWFPQGRSDLFLTLNLLEVCGRIRKISGNEKRTVIDDEVLTKASNYAKSQVLELVRKDSVKFPEISLYYAFIRSFYAESVFNGDEKVLLESIASHFKPRWSDMNVYQKAMYGKLCLKLENKTAKKIAASLIKQSVYSPEKGRYWNAGISYRWTDLPVERQVALMEFFEALGGYRQEVKQMAHWLMMQKRIQDWNTSGASMSACYGIFLLDDPGRLDQFDVQIRNAKGIMNQENEGQRLGYFRKDWYGNQIDSSLSSWEFDVSENRVVWGGLYATFWNKRDKIQPDAIEDLKMTREMFKVVWYNDTLLLHKLHPGDTLEVGDRIRIVFNIRAKSSFDYIHLRDPGFSGLQVVRESNGYRYSSNLPVYYQYTDENVDMFIDFLPRGNYTMQYDGIISHRGNFVQSSAHISSHFAPEFSASSGSSDPVSTR